MAENKYDITVRTLVSADEVKPIDNNVQEMYVQRFDNMTDYQVNLWIQQTMSDCINVLHMGNNPNPEITEQDIIDNFTELAQTLNDLEQAHDTQSITFKNLNGYITVQVIYPEEELT